MQYWSCFSLTSDNILFLWPLAPHNNASYSAQHPLCKGTLLFGVWLDWSVFVCLLPTEYETTEWNFCTSSRGSTLRGCRVWGEINALTSHVLRAARVEWGGTVCTSQWLRLSSVSSPSRRHTVSPINQRVTPGTSCCSYLCTEYIMLHLPLESYKVYRHVLGDAAL